ncbi:MAG: LysR family transcriptional regulator [Lachnospiraceae bacterium]
MFSSMNYIYEVYKEKSFSKAAKNLYISQPSLSASVKRIEQQIGTPLFDRSTNPIKLTDCGEAYIFAIEQIQGIEQDFQNYLADRNGLKVGKLTIGGSNLFSSYVLPPLISKYKERFPLIEIDLIEDSTSKLKELLQNGVLDLLIDNYVFSEDNFIKHLYRPEQLLLAVPKDISINTSIKECQLTLTDIKQHKHQKDDFPSVPLGLFEKEPFILLKTENDTRQRSLRICQEYGFQPHAILTLDQQVTAYNVTCSGMGISFISDTLAYNVLPHPDVVFYKLQGEAAHRNIYFYQKKNRYVTKAITEFLSFVTYQI